ncbi:MAG: DUF58 domain-containing protein, partial [Oligoflexales bacterium]
RRFVEIPIHPDLERIEQSFPPFLSKTISIRWFLIITSWIFFNIGVFSDSNGLIAFSLSLITYLHFLHYQTWSKANSLKINSVNYPTECQLGRSLPFSFTVSNSGKTTIENIEAIIIFNERLESWQHMISLNLKKKKKKNISLELKFDYGAGVFTIGPLYYKIVDDFHFYPKIMKLELEQTIAIITDTSPPVAPEIEIASIANQVGSIEMNIPGRSTNFYGLRPWAHGDSIRYIDWKRSIRKGDIIVKDFERLASTDAFIFFDVCHTVHSSYLNFSVFESLKSTTMSLALGLKHLNISTYLISQSNRINSDKDEEHLIEEIQKTRSVQSNHSNFPQIIEENLNIIPPESLVILVFCSSSFDPNNLSKCILKFEDQHIQCTSFIFDSQLYAKEIFKKIDITNLSEDPLKSFYSTIAKRKTNFQSYHNILGDIYWVKPQHNFLDHCSESEKLRILNE